LLVFNWLPFHDLRKHNKIPIAIPRRQLSFWETLTIYDRNPQFLKKRNDGRNRQGFFERQISYRHLYISNQNPTVQWIRRAPREIRIYRHMRFSSPNWVHPGSPKINRQTNAAKWFSK
jgi:hypothetical protein